MDRVKGAKFILLVLLGVLAFTILYQSSSQTLSPSVKTVSKQAIISAGDELRAEFKIINPGSKPMLYTYSLYLNNIMRYEDKAIVKPKRRFVFGGHYGSLEPGKIKVNAIVYEGDKEKLLENITYFVKVEEQVMNAS